MALILDILVVLIVGYVIYSNVKRGFSKVLAFGIGYFVMTLLASLIASAAAPAFYDGVARDSNISALQTANARVDFPKAFANAINTEQYGFMADYRDVGAVLADYKNGAFDDRLYQYVVNRTNQADRAEFDALVMKTFIGCYGKEIAERVPEYVITAFEDSVRADPNLMREIMRTYYDSGKSAEERAALIEKKFSEEPTTEVLQIFIYLILFSVFMVLAALVATMLQDRIFFNLHRGTEKFLGGMVGLVEAGSMLVLLTLVVRLVVVLGAGKFLFFNDEDLNSTYIFKYLYGNLRIFL